MVSAIETPMLLHTPKEQWGELAGQGKSYQANDFDTSLTLQSISHAETVRQAGGDCSIYPLSGFRPVRLRYRFYLEG